MVVNVIIVIANMNLIVNVVTKRKITRKKKLQEKEPQKNKTTTNWEKEEKFRKIMVDITH